MTDPSPAQPSDPQGRDTTAPWQMPWPAWREIMVRTWREASKDNVGLVAAGVSFYAFIAIVPTLGAIVLAYGLFASPETVLSNMQLLATHLPGEIAALISEQLINLVSTSSSRKGIGIVIALVVSLFGARNAAGAIITALNIAYEEEERRGFVRVTLIALAITIAAVLSALVGIALITAAQFLSALLPQAIPAVKILLRIVAGLVVLAGAAAGAATLYRYAPSREQAKWRWLTPGTALAAFGWLALFLGFGLYIRYFANFDATYGPLGAVVALLTFVYLASYIFLFGAELNSEFEHQTAKETTEGAPERLGQRGAWSADHVADGAEDRGTEELEPVRPPAPALSDRQSPQPPTPDHAFLASRATNRAMRLSGAPKIGLVASTLSTIGLTLLRRRGQEKAGVALLAAAAGLSLLRRSGNA